MLREWHTYLCAGCVAILAIGGERKRVICPGCDAPMLAAGSTRSPDSERMEA